MFVQPRSLGLLALLFACGCGATFDDAVASQDALGACLLAGEITDSPEDDAAQAKLARLVERLYPVELNIQRVTGGVDAQGAPISPTPFGELVAVTWRVGKVYPAGVSFVGIDPMSVRLERLDHARTTSSMSMLPEQTAYWMFTGKVPPRRSKTSFWSFLKGVFVDLPSIAFSAGLIDPKTRGSFKLGSTGRKVSLDVAVKTLSQRVNRRCERWPKDPWTTCSTLRAVIPHANPSYKAPTHLVVRLWYSLQNSRGSGCGFGEVKRFIPIRPGTGSPASRIAATFAGGWIPVQRMQRDR